MEPGVGFHQEDTGDGEGLTVGEGLGDGAGEEPVSTEAASFTVGSILSKLNPLPWQAVKPKIAQAVSKMYFTMPPLSHLVQFNSQIAGGSKDLRGELGPLFHI